MFRRGRRFLGQPSFAAGERARRAEFRILGPSRLRRPPRIRNSTGPRSLVSNGRCWGRRLRGEAADTVARTPVIVWLRAGLVTAEVADRRLWLSFAGPGEAVGACAGRWRRSCGGCDPVVAGSAADSEHAETSQVGSGGQ